MIKISIPGFRDLQLSHLVLDYNGTLAYDGTIIEGVRERLNNLANNLEVHILTADTFGMAKEQLIDVKCKLQIMPRDEQTAGKLKYVDQLGRQSTVCIGNGRNDCLMLKKAALGITVLQGEGGAVESMLAADLVVSNILDALDLLKNPLRLIATLRS